MADEDNNFDFGRAYNTTLAVADLVNAITQPMPLPVLYAAGGAQDAVVPGGLFDPVSVLLKGVGPLQGIFGIAGPSQFDDNTMYGRPYPMPGTLGSQNPFGVQSPSMDVQQGLSDYILNNPDLLAAYAGGQVVPNEQGLLSGLPSQQAQVATGGKTPQQYEEIPAAEGNAQSQDVVEGTYSTQDGTIWAYDAFGKKWKVYDPSAGGGGSTSSASTSASESSTPSVDTTIVGGDPDIIRGPTISAGDLGGASTGPRQVQTTGNEYVYPNEKIISPDAELVRVHNNPDGSSVLVYSDGAEVFNPNGKNPDFTKWPTTPTPGTVAETQQPTDWNKIIDEWLIFNPNATKEQARQVGEAANVPADILNARIEARFPTATTTTGNTNGTPGASTTPGTVGTTGTSTTPTTPGTTGTSTTPTTSGTTGTSTTPTTSTTPGISTTPGTTGTTGISGTPGTGGTPGTPGLPGRDATRTTDGLFGADLFKFQQEYSLVGNLLSYGNRGMFR